MSNTLKLYEIEIEGHAYVMAENEDDAVDVFKRETSRSDMHDLCDFTAIEDPHAVWSGWREAIPYGSKDSRKVGEIIEERLKEIQADIRKREYLAKHGQELPFG